ncbi:MFS transporter [Alicyclobacillus acidocaldarius]|uniref:Major facilitator superfamily MFS_1 n=1 Tax=Alicyclobacillus acidocaldarius (strain Tc-4-1) TaxID=1048834 RepID=F8IEM8_ALIAT|nr:MFS transporter [Alicyclobacillus acidocaldarius]AEJ42742.1 major facilitator superfamily MFS_1 [Alicyclobacillus acidocaldarius subsp. acidocaldarius Tc-4-1]
MSISTASPYAVQPTRKQVVTATIASLLGWSLDLFDLFVLLYVAPDVGKLFFPSTNATLSLASVYGSFAVTLLMRPLGSGLFGSLADRFGRKRAMITAVVGVGVLTALFGVLPTVHQVGVLAPILFLILRLVQGICVGGVVASTHTIGTESVSPKWRGLVSGLIGGGGAGIGSLIASIVYAIWSSVFPGPAFDVWGWRCMFFSGILSAVLGVFVFNSLEESPLWQQVKHLEAQTAPKAPVRSVFSTYRRILLVNLMITVGGGSGYYLTSGYLPTFFKVVNKPPHGTVSMALIAASLVVILAAVVVGHLSEVVGRKPVFLTVGVTALIAVPFLYHGMATTHSPGALVAYALILVFLGNAAYAPIVAFLNERFPTQVRSTGTGLSWNMGFAVGGMLPTFVSLAAGTTANIPTALTAFLMAALALYLIGALVIPETRGALRVS